jgi:hypothetical protein
MRVPNSLIREAIDEIHARAAYHELFGDKLGIPDPCQKIIGQYFVQNLEDRIDLDFVEVQEGT